MKTTGYLAVLCTLFPFHVNAQELPDPAGDTGDVRKRTGIVRTDNPPTIDGVLDDSLWQEATLVSDMHQFQPVDHGSPSESSEFYLAYDDNYFYLGARLYDEAPQLISARQLIQGGDMPFDDAFEFILDTFNNGRTGYFFQVNPNGIRREGVFENPTNLNTDWTGIWQVEARIDEQGWTAEVAIPFTTLNFDPDVEEWGFTIGRTIARKREELAWSSFNRQLNPTTTGLISGMQDMRQGIGLDLIPSVTLAGSEDHVNGETDSRFDPSLNAFYKFTPNLTGALTFNTDFSATAVDDRQVNLSRFSLFFPEKRDFFLQDLDIFSFGGIAQEPGPGAPNGTPFYSRRIGLSDTGQPVDIEAGAKLSGRVGRWNVGALAVQQDAYADIDAQPLMVARAAANVLEESSIGVIATSGDPTSNLDNSLMGADFRYQKTRFTDIHSLQGNLWYQQSDTEETEGGDEKAYGGMVDLRTQSSGVGVHLGYQYFGEDYNPGLGFANRRGVERMFAGANSRYFFDNHPVIRNIESFGHIKHARWLDSDELQSENMFWRMLNVSTHIGDEIGFGINRNREGLRTDFAIRPGIIIPAGEYTFGGYHVEVRGSEQRAFAPALRVDKQDYYDGESMKYEAELNWRPNRHVFFGMNYNYQQIELPQGDFDVRLVSVKADYAFNAKWSWVNLAQYDNFSGSVGVNSRLRWNPQAGEDLYLVINYNFDADGTFNRMHSRDSEIVLKYTKTFRF